MQRTKHALWGSLALMGLLAALTGCDTGGGTAIPAKPTYLYVSNFFDGTLSAYSVGEDGSLTATANGTVTTGANPKEMILSPDGKYLFVLSYYSGHIFTYAIGSTGDLTQAGDFTLNYPPGQPDGLAPGPDGQYLYVTSRYQDIVSVVEIGSDGTLSGERWYDTGTKPYGVAVSPNGKYLYLVNQGDDTIQAFAIADDGGISALTTDSFTGTIATADTPEGIAIDSEGTYLYAVCAVNGGSDAGKLCVYAIGSDGTLSAAGSYDTERWPTTVTISPDGKNLYVALVVENKVALYSIGSGGTLTLVETYATGKAPQRAAVTPDGSFLYVANHDYDTLSLFSIGSGGVLTPLDGSPLAAGNGPWGITARQ